MDCTKNVYIKNAEFGKMADDYKKIPRKRRHYNNELDSLWQATLKIAEQKKNTLKLLKSPTFNQILLMCGLSAKIQYKNHFKMVGILDL